MNEKLIEKKLREEVKKLGGLALKFSSQSYTGMPDRIILMPKGKTYWVELKTTGKELSPVQAVRAIMLDALGFNVWLISSEEKLNEFLQIIK